MVVTGELRPPGGGSVTTLISTVSDVQVLVETLILITATSDGGYAIAQIYAPHS